MEKVYTIKHEPVTLRDGSIKDKYNIYYFGGIHDGMKEFYAYVLTEPQTEIREGYSKQPDSL